MRKFMSLLVLLFGSNLFAVPSGNKLIKPDSVVLKKSGKLAVTFTLPCKYDDWVGFVMTNDDSGDQVIAVGVVYPQDSCRPAKSKRFTQEVDPKPFGYTEGTFEPMDVSP